MRGGGHWASPALLQQSGSPSAVRWPPASPLQAQCVRPDVLLSGGLCPLTPATSAEIRVSPQALFHPPHGSSNRQQMLALMRQFVDRLVHIGQGGVLLCFF